MYAVFSHQVITGPAVAHLFKTKPGSPSGHSDAEPWVLRHATGRIDRFARLLDARAEAIKSWPSVSFRML